MAREAKAAAELDKKEKVLLFPVFSDFIEASPGKTRRRMEEQTNHEKACVLFLVSSFS